MSIDWRILSQVGRLCGPARAKADAQKLSQLSKNEIVVSEIEITAIILTIFENYFACIYGIPPTGFIL
jgi:hypothetical protein